VQRLQSRDPHEFDLLVAREGTKIQRLVGRLAGWHEREDLAQEVFVRAWQSIHRFRGQSDVGTWLSAIAVNVCRNHRRRFQTWQKVLQIVTAAKRNDRTHAIDGWTATEQVMSALDQLSQSDREMIVLCCLEEQSVDRAAELLGKKKNAVEVGLHRARKRLKNLLEIDHESE
jgi:RNA polymerase sigma-70 factor (ECF subfamily)